MKRNIFMMAAVALLAMACTKEQQPASETSGDSDKVVLYASVEDTKAVVDYENPDENKQASVAFEVGDKMSVWFQTNAGVAEEGTLVEFTCERNYADGSAKFTAEAASIPKEFVAAKAAYPAASLSAKGTFSLVRNYTYDPDSMPIYVRCESVVKKDDGSLSAHLVHNASIIKFTLHDIPAYAAGFVVEMRTYETNEEGQYIGQDKNPVDVQNAAVKQIIRINTLFPYKTGYTADPTDHSNDITLYSAAAHSSYLTRVYLIDGDGGEIEGSERKFKQSWNDVSKNDFIIMPRIDFNKAELRKDYVVVKGVKWAKGNLQCIRGTEESGFQGGWRLAPAQWHHLTYKDNPSKAEAYAYTNTSDNYEHFNYGGIARQARFMSDGNYIQPGSTTLDISGKMYSDVHATNEVTGLAALEEIDSFASSNHNRLWGDIAFWASKGKFRMPTAAEFKTLHNEVHKLTGEYTTPDGLKVYGTLFRTVLPGENRQGTDGHVFTDADLESGLFLPKAGRKYDGAGYVINNVTTQGTYRSSTFVKSVDLDDNDTWTNLNKKYISAYYHISGSTPKGYGPNMTSVSNDFGHSAAYLIRPVLVEESAE